MFGPFSGYQYTCMVLLNSQTQLFRNHSTAIFDLINTKGVLTWKWWSNWKIIWEQGQRITQVQEQSMVMTSNNSNSVNTKMRRKRDQWSVIRSIANQWMCMCGKLSLWAGDGSPPPVPHQCSSLSDRAVLLWYKCAIEYNTLNWTAVVKPSWGSGMEQSRAQAKWERRKLAWSRDTRSQFVHRMHRMHRITVR